jgi:lipid A ethanolaminephosphotransferase
VRWLARADAVLRRERSARAIVLWLAAWLTVFANWPLWLELARIGGAPSLYLPKIALMAILVFTGAVALLSFTAWSRGMKPLWLGILLLAAVVQHYMLSYHMVMDPTMIANVFQTDAHEALDLLNWRLAFNVLWVALLPALWLVRVQVRPMGLWAHSWRNAALCGAALAAAAVGALSMQRELAPLMRNNVTLRYMMNPVASVYSAGAVALKPLFQRSRKLVPITAGTAPATPRRRGRRCSCWWSARRHGPITSP